MVNTSSWATNNDVSVDIFEALKMAFARIPRFIPPPDITWGSIYRPPVMRRLPFAKPLPVAPIAEKKRNDVAVAAKVVDNTEDYKDKRKRVKRELLDAGITMYGLLKSETRLLPKVIHDNEHVHAVVYGQHHSSSAMLVATDSRIIYLDVKPMATLLDEVTYEVVSGIQFDIHMFYATLVLHTPVKNYDFKYANLRCAEKFAKHIEEKRMEKQHHDQEKEQAIEAIAQKTTQPEVSARNAYDKENLAGYYWLPMEDAYIEEEEEGEKGLIGPAPTP